MVTQQCSHTIRGPKRGRIYVYDAKQCQRMVEVPEGTTGYSVKCWQHKK